MTSGDRRSGGDQLDNGRPGHDVDGMESGVDNVLGLARTGLIFTGIQEGTQPGGLTPPGQPDQGIPYHVPSCWVPVGGEQGGRNSLAAWECAAPVRERAAVFCGLCSAGLFCVFPFSVSLLFLFPLFAVL